VGWSADIAPVPKTGRIRFSQIGNLSKFEHGGERNIDLSDQKYQQMIGNLSSVTPIDPEAWRGAIWHMGTKINRGVDQPPPHPDAWMEGFINLWDGSKAGTDYDVEKQAMFVQAHSPAAGRMLTALIYYVGKVPAGTKVKVACDLRAQNDHEYGEPVYLHTRGWSNGWFGTNTGGSEDFKQYATFQLSTARGYGEWFAYEEEFEVLDGFQDVWVALEVTSNDPARYPGSLNMGWARDLSLKLA
jgi:hypothetical protein